MILLISSCSLFGRYQINHEVKNAQHVYRLDAVHHTYYGGLNLSNVHSEVDSMIGAPKCIPVKTACILFPFEGDSVKQSCSSLSKTNELCHQSNDRRSWLETFLVPTSSGRFVVLTATRYSSLDYKLVGKEMKLQNWQLFDSLYTVAKWDIRGIELMRVTNDSGFRLETLFIFKKCDSESIPNSPRVLTHMAFDVGVLSTP